MIYSIRIRKKERKGSVRFAFFFTTANDMVEAALVVSDLAHTEWHIDQIEEVQADDLIGNVILREEVSG